MTHSPSVGTAGMPMAITAFRHATKLATTSSSAAFQAPNTDRDNNLTGREARSRNRNWGREGRRRRLKNRWLLVTMDLGCQRLVVEDLSAGDGGGVYLLVVVMALGKVVVITIITIQSSWPYLRLLGHDHEVHHRYRGHDPGGKGGRIQQAIQMMFDCEWLLMVMMVLNSGGC